MISLLASRSLIFNFDFVETATLVACINKILHTRPPAVFNFQFSIFNF